VPPAGLRELGNILQPIRKSLEADGGLLRLLTSNQAVPLHEILGSFRSLPSRQRREVMDLLQSDALSAERFVMAMKSESGDEYRTGFTGLPQSLQASCDYMRRYFAQSIRYLGPLRDEPKALYPLAGGVDPMDVGLKGENTAAVLDLHKSRLTRFLSPAAFAEPAITADAIHRTLKTAVTDWLKYLGVAENVESIDRGKLGHELKIRIDERSGDQDLTHVGVGVSQVLPILVMCLLADLDTVLLFEQPELHLHPKVQTLLGDFFLSMAMLKKQCIIETHSEYLINRLRFRAAAAKSDNVASQMTIYFVEKKQDKSQFRPIVVNEFGAIQDWPEGFFDQSQREAEETLKAAVKKKRHLAQTRKS
jgi:predicted ATPase